MKPHEDRSVSPDELDEWMATGTGFARQLTESGSRCHLNGGKPRFCSWQATELPANDVEGGPGTMVGVRCASHPGGRYLDPNARLAPEDLAQRS